MSFLICPTIVAAAALAGGTAPAIAAVQAAPAAPVPVLPNVPRVSTLSVTNLLQRPTSEYARHRVQDFHVPPCTRRCDTTNTFKLHQTQEAYNEYCHEVRAEYCDEFWRVFETVYREPAVVIDRVLKTCRDLFIPSKRMKALFDPSVRVMRANILKKHGDFPSHVMHSIRIDLRQFSLPGIEEV